MRIISRYGFPVNLESALGVSVIDPQDISEMERHLTALNAVGYGDAPFTLIGDTEIPPWVRDGEALEALGYEE